MKQPLDQPKIPDWEKRHPFMPHQAVYARHDVVFGYKTLAKGSVVTVEMRGAYTVRGEERLWMTFREYPAIEFSCAEFQSSPPDDDALHVGAATEPPPVGRASDEEAA